MYILAALLDKYSKGDRVITNYGTTKEPEYWAATVTKIGRKTQLVYVRFDDGSTDKFPATRSAVGLVGHASHKRKRKTEIPASDIGKWLVGTKPKVDRKALRATPPKPRQTNMDRAPSLQTQPSKAPKPSGAGALSYSATEMRAINKLVKQLILTELDAAKIKYRIKTPSYKQSGDNIITIHGTDNDLEIDIVWSLAFDILPEVENLMVRMTSFSGGAEARKLQQKNAGIFKDYIQGLPFANRKRDKIDPADVPPYWWPSSTHDWMQLPRSVRIDEIKNGGDIDTANLSHVRGFCDFLAGICWPYLYDDPEGKIENWLIQSAKDATPLIEKYKLGVSSWDSFIKQMRSNTVYDLEDRITAFIEKLRGKINVIGNDMDVSRIEQRFITVAARYWATGSEASINQLVNLVGKATSPSVAAYWVSAEGESIDEHKAAETALNRLLKKLKLGGRARLSTEDKQILRERDPEALKEYNRLVRISNQSAKQTISDLTRTSGPIALDDLRAELDRAGVRHSLPTGFVGKVDEHGFYTVFGEKLNGTPSGVVTMNPNYTKGSSVYVLKYKAPHAKGESVVYTAEAQDAAREDKFSRVGQAIEMLPKAMARWRRDMRNGNEEAHIMELVFLTSGRIGTQNGKVRGLSTLRVKEVTDRGNWLRISYIGKDSLRQIHEVHPEDVHSRRLIKFIKARLADRNPSDEVFDMSARHVNEYVKSVLKLPITTHKMRTIRGSVLMRELLEAAKGKLAANPQPKTVLTAFKAAAVQVGRILGHSTKSAADGSRKVTGATAIKHYIDPGVMIEFFEYYSMRVPPELEAVYEKWKRST